MFLHSVKVIKQEGHVTLGPVSSIKFLGQILKVSWDIFWDMRRSVSSKRLKKILRHNFAFHQNVGIERWLQNNLNARFTTYTWGKVSDVALVFCARGIYLYFPL